MKREKGFYYSFVMFLFVTCYITCYILSNRTIEFGGLIATASALVYPLTYFIGILFYERYGKNKTFELVNFSVISLIFMGILIAFASTFDVYGGKDGLEKLFQTDFRILFSSIVGFMVGQYLMIKIYNYLGEKKGFDFLVAGVISITVDSFLFILLGHLGSEAFTEVVALAVGQYALNVIAIIIYSLCFNSIINTLIEHKEPEETYNEIKEEIKVVKKPAVKKTTTKTTKTVKKEPAKKATKKTTTTRTKKEEK